MGGAERDKMAPALGPLPRPPGPLPRPPGPRPRPSPAPPSPWLGV
jgi:hypothetical protein